MFVAVVVVTNIIVICCFLFLLLLPSPSYLVALCHSTLFVVIIIMADEDTIELIASCYNTSSRWVVSQLIGLSLLQTYTILIQLQVESSFFAK